MPHPPTQQGGQLVHDLLNKNKEYYQHFNIDLTLFITLFNWKKKTQNNSKIKNPQKNPSYT